MGNTIYSSIRKVSAKVELYNSNSTLAYTFTEMDRIKDFTIERIGEDSKFFGFGICQKIKLSLIDTKRELSIKANDYIKISIHNFKNLPNFYITEVRRDENTNELSVIGYDALYNANNHKVNEIELEGYTISQFATKCATKIGVGVPLWKNVEADSYNTNYPNGANFEGTETIRDALNDIAEATQTIYFLNNNNALVFKRLNAKENAISINKSDYFTLTSRANKRLARIIHTTELGDNVEVKLAESGSTQIVKDNAFWELREDIQTLLERALANIGGITINQFECHWRGNPSWELGSKLKIQTKDNKEIFTYLINDTMHFDGSFNSDLAWKYEADDENVRSNPTSLGEALKETFARVDKQNKEIQLVASQTDANSTALGSLKVNTDSVNASVSKLSKQVEDNQSNVSDSLAQINESLSTKLSATDLTLEIKKEIANAEIDKVTTSTGFTFNQDGLRVDKSNSEMATTITEDGMKVYRNSDEVLVANNQGVDAINLHATTYLMIGTNSRFEDYGDNRTGCFYIGRHN